MTESTQQADRRTRLLEAATAAMIEFERRESDFRKKDQAERAAELRLPLDQIKVHCTEADSFIELSWHVPSIVMRRGSGAQLPVLIFGLDHQTGRGACP